jgi:hypothetical protein
VQEALPFITNGGAVGVLAWVFWQVLRGNLVPKSTHDKVIAEKDVQIKILERVADNYRQTLERKDGLIPAQLESAQTVEKLALALQQGLAAKTEENTS